MNSPIICAGLHRSGTSLASQIIHLSGVPFAIQKMAGNNSNPDGHFEDLVAMHIHDDFLRESGSNWQFHNECEINHEPSIVKRIKSYSDCRNQLDGPLWLMKDPRATLFLDDWQSALDGNGKFVLMYRHWGLCVQSLLKRHSQDIAHGLPMGKALTEHIIFWQSPELAARMWLAYSKAMIKFIKANRENCLVVSQFALMQGYDLIAAINCKFDAQLAPLKTSPVKIEYASESIDTVILDGLSDQLQSELNDTYQQLAQLCDTDNAVHTPEYIETPSDENTASLMLARIKSAKNVKDTNELDSPSGLVNQLYSDYQNLPFDDLLSKLQTLKPLANKDNANSALPLALRLITLDPCRVAAHEWAGRIYTTLGQHKNSEIHFVKAMAIGNTPPYIKMLLADTYVARYDFKQAEFFYILAFKSNSQNPQFSIKLAELYCIKKEYGKAIKSYQAALLLNDNDWVRVRLINAIDEYKGTEIAIEFAKASLVKNKTILMRNTLLGLKLKSRSGDSKKYYKQVVKEGITREKVNDFLTGLGSAELTDQQLQSLVYWLSMNLNTLFSEKELLTLLQDNVDKNVMSVQQPKMPEVVDNLILAEPAAKLTHSVDVVDTNESEKSRNFQFPKGFDLRPLNIEKIILLIESNVSFSMARLCHGFWEQCVRFDRQIGLDQKYNKDFSVLVDEANVNWPLSLFQELAEFMQAKPTSHLFWLVSEFGWRDALVIEGTPLEGVDETRKVMSKMLNPDWQRLDGLFWKNSIVDGSFSKFVDFIRNRPVVIVGPEYVQNFSQFTQLKQARYVGVNSNKAAWDRSEILTDIIATIEKFDQKGVICLIEAGGVTSSWLVAKLLEKLPEHVYLALGQALNICNVGKLEGINWFEVERDQVLACIDEINPQWNILQNDFVPKSGYASLSDKERWCFFKQGLDPVFLKRINDIKDEKILLNKLAFIENKAIDYSLLEKTLTASKEKNHWANFGPVSLLLEKYLEQKLKIQNEKKIVMLKSGTQALHLLIALEETKSKRKMRWVVSAFGFIASKIGPLSDAVIVDCDVNGMIDLSLVDALKEEWDGLIVTNAFGLSDDLKRYESYCKKLNKICIIDNATGLFTPENRNLKSASQAISFHQTKPWGMGEGGCAIILPEDEKTFRALTNFGVGGPKYLRQNASNAKISDVDCAIIFQRLATMAQWGRRYALQSRRILKLAKLSGLKMLAENKSGVILGSLPLIAEHQISKESFSNQAITLRKYYSPLSSSAIQANEIYSHIVNFPCHHGLASISDEDILEVMHNIQSPSALNGDMPI